MSRTKNLLLAITIIFICIQFVQPAHNKSGQVLPSDLSKMFSMSDTVETALKNACFDCHSNNTMYPWYSNIQPMGWLMAKHIRQGKKVLNFSEFGNYTARKQISKLKGSASQIREGEMPISSYKLLHKMARLTEVQKTLLIDWMNRTADSLSASN